MSKREETKIIAWARKQFRPKAIILYGSRATRRNHRNSDWDLLILVDYDPPKKHFFAEIEKSLVEGRVFSMQLPTGELKKKLGPRLQFVKLLWEEGDEGTVIIEQAKRWHLEGYRYTKEELAEERIFMEILVRGMHASHHEPFMFMKYWPPFFEQAIFNWFPIKRQEYPKPWYVARELIDKYDPAYARLLAQLADPSVTFERKCLSADRIYQYLFKV